MNVLVIGNGGREHALCYGIKKSSSCNNLFCIPGSDGIGQLANCFNIQISNHALILNFCIKNKIDLVVIGPEIPLTEGLSDYLEANSVLTFGPSKAGAELENSKKFTKDICKKLNIPTASYVTFDNHRESMEYLNSCSFPLVIKADGLAAGKGVIICHSINDALEAINKCFNDKTFGIAGSRVVIEEFLEGEEVSLFALVDSTGFVLPLITAQDHKKILEGEKGLNTGGMGSYAPVPSITKTKMIDLSNQFVLPIVEYLKKENINFKGMFYAGLIFTKNGPQLLEINVRFGDPETQAIIPLLESDLLHLLYSSASGQLKEIKDIKLNDKFSMSVVMASKGYPENFKKLTEIKNIQNLDLSNKDYLFHAGTKFENNKWLSNGGRVLNFTHTGEDLTKIRANIHKMIKKISWEEGYYRKDIGWRYIDD